MRSLFAFSSSVLAALGLLLLGSAAQALTVSVSLGGNPADDYGMGDLGCVSAGSNGQLQCDGGGLTGPGGGWTLDSWSMFLDPDPTVSNTFSVTNNTGATQSFVVSVVLPVSLTFGPPSLIRGSIDGGATDLNADGVTLSSTAPDSIYTALIDGSAVRTLLDDPISATNPAAFGSVGIGPVDFGIPVQESVAVATTTSIGITLRFDLTAGDSASFTSVFNVEPVPEPGTALLMLAGLAGLARAGRVRR